MVKVSVIVPIYNQEKYLASCLTSLMRQRLDDMEFILIDDASSDQSYSIMKKYAARDKRMHIYHLEHNQGVGAVRNMGFTLARGEYIGFVDSDDYIGPTMYQYMVAAAEEMQADLVETGLKFVLDDQFLDQDLDYAVSKTGYFLSSPSKQWLLDLSPSVCNKLFKRSLLVLEKFAEDVLWEDLLFTVKVGVKANGVLFMNNPDYFYRRRVFEGRSSLNYHKNNQIFSIFKITDQFFSFDDLSASYQKTLEMISVTAIFTRIEEMSYWEISDQTKQEILERFFSMIFVRYGSLEDLDFSLLSSRVRLDWLYLYQDYVRKEQDAQKKCKFLKKGE